MLTFDCVKLPANIVPPPIPFMSDFLGEFFLRAVKAGCEVEGNTQETAMKHAG